MVFTQFTKGSLKFFNLENNHLGVMSLGFTILGLKTDDVINISENNNGSFVIFFPDNIACGTGDESQDSKTYTFGCQYQKSSNNLISQSYFL